ncbi:MAG TPA: hypothetical protein DER09_11420 [Prolixibacteraceae bacterium]|nr:hypothetical protein [Prolixibacteraceae bacterium]
MKTKNNVQKTVLSTSAVIISLVLISFTVTAQDFWKMVITNSSFNEIALAMTDTHEKPKSQPVNHETWVEKLSPVEEQEQELAVEDWMKKSSNFSASELLTHPETESNLKVEDWMMDENHFGTGDEIEMPLITEPWMYNERTWTR